KMPEDIGSEVGYDSFAESRDKIKSRSRSQRENPGDRDEGKKIRVDQARAFSRKAEIDHAPDRQRHRQGCCRRHSHREQRRSNARLVAQKIGRELQERAGRVSSRLRRNSPQGMWYRSSWCDYSKIFG